MKFEWDENKRLVNFKKHKIDFIDARLLFRKPHKLISLKYTLESRWMIVGELHNKIISIVYTKRDEVIRIVSARRASKYERRKYKNLY